jgi:hypothetical protein
VAAADAVAVAEAAAEAEHREIDKDVVASQQTTLREKQTKKNGKTKQNTTG